MSTHFIIERDNREATYHAMGEVYEESHVDAACTLRGALHAHLLQGGNLGPETGTMAETLYVQTRDESDYDERRDAAKDAYLGEESFWREIVRDVLTQAAYTDEHFEERAMDEEDLPRGALAAVATFWAVGFWWQMGHFNLLTQQWERVSWFIEPTARWAQMELERSFDNFEARVQQKVGL
jgi:hypothetical protein